MIILALKIKQIFVDVLVSNVSFPPIGTKRMSCPTIAFLESLDKSVSESAPKNKILISSNSNEYIVLIYFLPEILAREYSFYKISLFHNYS